MTNYEAGKDGATSITIISAVLIAINSILNAFGVGLAEIDGVVNGVATLIAAITAIYGRVRATQPITSIAGVKVP